MRQQNLFVTTLVLLVHAAQTRLSTILRSGNAIHVEHALNASNRRQHRVQMLRISHFKGNWLVATRSVPVEIVPEIMLTP